LNASIRDGLSKGGILMSGFLEVPYHEMLGRFKQWTNPQSPINCVMHNGSRPVSAVKQSAGVKIATTGVSRPAW
jgi:hypothetical protein